MKNFILFKAELIFHCIGRGAMAQACNSVIPASWEGEIKRIMVQDQSRQKVPETPFQPVVGNGGVHLSSQLPGVAQIGRQQSRPARA
jgi:hypothetical protein